MRRIHEVSLGIAALLLSLAFTRFLWPFPMALAAEFGLVYPSPMALACLAATVSAVSLAAGLYLVRKTVTTPPWPARLAISHFLAALGTGFVAMGITNDRICSLSSPRDSLFVLAFVLVFFALPWVVLGFRANKASPILFDAFLAFLVSLLLHQLTQDQAVIHGLLRLRSFLFFCPLLTGFNYALMRICRCSPRGALISTPLCVLAGYWFFRAGTMTC